MAIKVSNEFMANLPKECSWKALSNTSNKILFQRNVVLKIIGMVRTFQVIKVDYN